MAREGLDAGWSPSRTEANLDSFDNSFCYSGSNYFLQIDLVPNVVGRFPGIDLVEISLGYSSQIDLVDNVLGEIYIRSPDV